MQAISRLLVLFAVMAISTTTYGQVARIKTGDVLQYDPANAKQIGLDPVSFVWSGQQELRISITTDGDHIYANGDESIFSQTNRDFTRVIDKGVPVEEKYLFHIFLQGKTPEPGQTWETEFKYLDRSGSDNIVRYRVLAEVGPKVNILINGKPTEITTVSVKYKGTINSTMYSWWGQAEKLTLWSPELHEIVADQFVGITSRGFLMRGGYRWSLTSINTVSNK